MEKCIKKKLVMEKIKIGSWRKRVSFQIVLKLKKFLKLNMFLSFFSTDF